MKEVRAAHKSKVMCSRGLTLNTSMPSAQLVATDDAMFKEGLAEITKARIFASTMFVIFACDFPFGGFELLHFSCSCGEKRPKKMHLG